MAREPLDLLQGTLDVLILKTLSWGPLHGYAVSRWIRQRTDEVLAVEDAALYQALHRLERKGLIEAEWGLSENNRRAKFYALTPAGRKQLARETREWQRTATFAAVLAVGASPERWRSAASSARHESTAAVIASCFVGKPRKPIARGMIQPMSWPSAFSRRCRSSPTRPPAPPPARRGGASPARCGRSCRPMGSGGRPAGPLRHAPAGPPPAASASRTSGSRR